MRALRASLVLPAILAAVLTAGAAAALTVDAGVSAGIEGPHGTAAVSEAASVSASRDGLDARTHAGHREITIRRGGGRVGIGATGERGSLEVEAGPDGVAASASPAGEPPSSGLEASASASLVLGPTGASTEVRGAATNG